MSMTAVIAARTATNQLASAMAAVPAVSVCRLNASHDETLMGLVSLISSWQRDMDNYCAEGEADKAAEMAAWITVGWSVYREELLACA